MLGIGLILAAIVMLGGSGLPACVLSPRTMLGQRVTTLLMVVGSVMGLCGVAMAMGELPGAGAGAGAVEPRVEAGWLLPWGTFVVSVDAISAMFLVPVFVVPALGSVYGLGYWKQTEHVENGRWLGVFYGLIAGAIALVVIAREGVLFLMAWEVMALAAYFAVVTEGSRPVVRRVGWVYLMATHAGTLGLFAMFALWRHATGSLALEPGQAIEKGMANAIFVVGLVAFSFKAGLFPLHFWLPGAHANVPSHLSAVMSGVLLKTGVYGLVRMTSLLPQPPLWWGGTLLAAGAVTGLLGIAFALSQRDYKRLLAYSSVENIGVIAMGLGLAMLGRSRGQVDWMLLGLGGALLHVWNHSLFKSLLFLNAGAILHAVHTREMDRLGGLGKRMPISMGVFAIGAIAICALPPLNGFVSEWLLYIGLFRTLGLSGAASVPGAAVAAVALATIGALAVACFVKVFAVVYLGEPRSEATVHARDPGVNMLGPMVVLAVACVALGLFPQVAAPLLERATWQWAGLPDATVISIDALAPLGWITVLGLVLVALVGGMSVGMKLLMRGRTVGRAVTWDCGYARPTARMQYTGSSFTQMLVDLLGWIVWPRRIRVAIADLFARTSRFKMDTPDLVLDRGLSPAAAAIMQLLPWARRFQQGSVHAYLLYVLLMVVVLFLLGS